MRMNLLLHRTSYLLARPVCRVTCKQAWSRTMAATTKKPVLTFVTGNKKKLEEVQRILKEASVPFDITNTSLDLPELQGEPEEVALEKCKLAAKEVNGPVFCEDTSLCFNALGGLPGVYIKWFLAKLGHDGLNNMLAAYEDKSAYAQCIFAFTPGPHQEPQVFVGRVPGKIVPPRGPTDFGWDPVFEPDTEHKQTYAEMDSDVKSSLSHRAVALGKLCEHLREHCAEVTAAIGSPAPAEG